MEMKTIDASMLAKMFLAGAKSLEAHKDEINELNVFPVPDGDTGTNMTMTIMSAAREVAGLMDAPEMKPICKAISSGSLRGARGNSGVILSQLFRGFTKVIRNEQEITVPILAAACNRAAETAYKAVMKPKEGTILTVARAAADKAIELADQTEDVLVLTQEVVAAAEETLQKTPDMLPVLKQAGVVDSGGAGLLQVLKGGLQILSGENVDLTIENTNAENKDVVKKQNFQYHLEFKLVITKPATDQEREKYKSYLVAAGSDVKNTQSGDTITTVMDTNAPGEIITRATGLGSISDITLTNQMLSDAPKASEEKAESPAEEAEAPAEAPETEKAAAEHKAFGFVSVCAGDGMAEIFKGIGADYVISGGQTMNPSTDDILNAVDHVNADTIFILPNNKNIILAANQAVSLEEKKRLIVIPTKTVPQGITALINFVPDDSAEENEKRMNEEIGHVKTGQITYAVRDTVIDDKEISKGNLMGMGDSGLLSVGTDMKTVMLETLKNMVDEESALISIYAGADVTDSDAQDIRAAVAEAFPGLDIELEKGGQPVYYYVFSVE
ncbi:MAG: DAK2 domain-containing protein [Lachnospiraceae bacterium]|nr:DAK2 domain-containing protein [Lachnospiraceae bacterium]